MSDPQKLALLALALFGFTLPVPLIVWGMSGDWRQAVQAWWWYGRYMLVLYGIGAVVWFFMWIQT